jgi:hypothetical protein
MIKNSHERNLAIVSIVPPLLHHERIQASIANSGSIA